MSIVNDKLEELKRCIGEKKLKQLGLIPCSTCSKIMEQAASFKLPTDLEQKTFLTEEEMSNINQTIASSASQTIGAPLAPSASSSTEENTNTPEEENKSQSPTATISIGQEDLQNEQAFIKKLASILQYSQPAGTEDLGMGYLYTCPSIPLPHSLCCSECGRLFAIAHPTLELLPLPIYLTESEYELIKGVYVDILL